MRFAPFEEAELVALATGDRGRILLRELRCRRVPAKLQRYCDVTIGHSIYPQRKWSLPINGSQRIKGGVLSKVGRVSKTEKV
jgi:hypothetical protein